MTVLLAPGRTRASPGAPRPPAARLTASWKLDSVAYSLAFMPGRRKALAGTQEGTLILIDFGSERPKTIATNEREPIHALAMNDEGTLALGAQGRRLLLWEVEGGRQRAVWMEDPPAWVSSVAFSPDGKKALSGSYNNNLTLREVATGRVLSSWKGHRFWVTSVAFSPDGRRVLSSSYDGTIRLWDAVTGSTLSSWEGHRCWVYSLGFSSDGAKAVTGSRDNALKVWSIAGGLRTGSGSELSSPDDSPRREINSLAIAGDGLKTLGGGWDGTLRLRDASTGKDISVWPGHPSWISAVAIAPDGSAALSAGADRSIRLWKLSSD